MSEWFMLALGAAVSVLLGAVWVVEAWGDHPLKPRHRDMLVGITVLFAVAILNGVISLVLLAGDPVGGAITTGARLFIRGLLLFAGIYAGVRLLAHHRRGDRE